MSKIFQSGSGVAFETVRFLDLDSKKAGSDSFVASKMEAGTAKTAAKSTATNQPGKKKTDPKPPPEPEIDLEALKQEAYEQGKHDAFQKLAQTLQTSCQAMASGLEELQKLKETILTNSKEDMVRLIMAVAERVIQTEVLEKEEIVTKTVIRALSAAVQSEEYTVKVHPDDLESVKEHKPLFLARIKGLERIHLLADESISRGGCLAESRVGDVDATLETQLQEMSRQLHAEIAS